MQYLLTQEELDALNGKNAKRDAEKEVLKAFYEEFSKLEFKNDSYFGPIVKLDSIKAAVERTKARFKD